MKRRTATALLAALFALSTLTGAVYMARDTVPPRWDAAGHLLCGLEYGDLLRGGHVRAFLWGHYAYYPPLVYQITGGLHAVTNRSPRVDWIVLQAFALVLVVATYRLGRTAGGRPAALLAAAVVLLLPIVTVFTREFTLEVPLTAMAAAFDVLVMRRPFARASRAAALGAVMGLGLLAKWAFAIVALGPLAYAMAAALRGPAPRAATVRRMGLALALALVLAAPWYGAHFRTLWKDARVNAVDVARAEGDPAPASAAGLLFYPRMVVDEWLYVPLTLLLLVSAARVLRRRGPVRLLLGVVVLPGWLLLTAIPNKDPRYALPLLPVLGVVLGEGLLGQGAGRGARALAVAVAALLAVQHVGGVAPLGPLAARTNVCLPEGTVRVYDPADPGVYFAPRVALAGTCRSEWTLFNPYSYFGHPPRREDWPLAAIVAALPAGARLTPPPASDVHFNPTVLQYTARRAGRVIEWGPPARATAWIAADAAPPPGETIDTGACRRFARPDRGVVTVCLRR